MPHARRVLGLDVVEVHDLVLDVEIEFAPEKAAEVLVDEIIEAVAGGVIAQMFFQERAIGILFRGCFGGKSGLPSSSRRKEALTSCPRIRMSLLTSAATNFSGEDLLDGERVQLALLALVRIGPVFKLDDEFAVGFQQRSEPDGRFGGAQDETAFLSGGGFFVVRLGVRLDEFEMDSLAIRQLERVVAQKFAGLDVVLVGVGPMQFHFLAFVGNGIDAGLVAAQRQKIAAGIIAAEEIGEIGQDFIFQRGHVHGGGKLGAKVFYFVERLALRRRHAERLGVLDGFFYFSF